MEPMPAFNVRHGESWLGYPLFRAYVGPDALYLVRVRWVFGLTRGGRMDLGLSGPDGCWTVLLAIPIIGILAGIGWLTKRASIRRMDARGPEASLGRHRRNQRIETAQVAESRLDPPVRHYDGEQAAFWTLRLLFHPPTTYFIEEQEGLAIAREHLTRLLGKKQAVNIQ